MSDSDNGEPEEPPKLLEEPDSSEVARRPEEIPEPPAMPSTRAPISYNTQINVARIPPSAWDRLEPEQVMELSRDFLQTIETTDERSFKYAMDQAERADNTGRRNTYVSSGVALAGYALTAFLAWNGQTLIATVVATFISVVLAVVVGRHLGD